MGREGAQGVDVIIYLIAIGLMIAGGALALFLWSLRSGQFDDLDGAANRILFDDDDGPRPSPPPPPTPPKS